MSSNMESERSALRGLGVGELRTRYAQLFGDTTNNRHRTWLINRILWRIQALAEGDLSERARQRALELASDADLRLSPPRPPRPRTLAVAEQPTPRPPSATEFDSRLPLPGSRIVRKYKGQVLQVDVLADGFSYAGQTYSSLSAVAKAITGSHCNGFHFFRLRKGQA